MSFWSDFYDKIFEHPERPEQNIIENDDLLDKWVQDKTKEMEQLARKNSRKRHGSPSMGAYDHSEVITFGDEEDEEYDEDYEEYDEEYEYED